MKTLRLNKTSMSHDELRGDHKGLLHLTILLLPWYSAAGSIKRRTRTISMKHMAHFIINIIILYFQIYLFLSSKQGWPDGVYDGLVPYLAFSISLWLFQLQLYSLNSQSHTQSWKLLYNLSHSKHTITIKFVKKINNNFWSS